MKRFLALTLLVLCTTHLGRAAIVYSGLQNIPITTTFNGIYIDLDNAATSGSAFVGWDINPFYGGAGIANNTTFQPARTGTGNLDAIIQLDFGDLISGGLNYSTGFGGSGNPNSHLGTGVDQFAVGTEGYIGFKLTLNDTSGPYFGWMRVTLTNNVAGGVISDWAYDDTGAAITAGAMVPEPGRMTLICAGMIGLAARRRRRVCLR